MTETGSDKQRTKVQRKSDREIVVTRTFNGPARLVFKAWTDGELFKRWWVPKSSGLTLLSCEMDVRTGGSYRLVFRHPAAPDPMAFFGRYVEVTPSSRLVWTNEEGEGVSTTTVTFEDQGDKTVVVVHEVHPSKESLDGQSGADALVESFDQLEELLAELR